MKHSVIAMLLLFIAVLIGCNSNNKEDAAKAAPKQEDLVKRGEYLVQITGCNDCHSPKKMGANGPEIIPELMLSGYAKNTPIPKGDKDDLSSGMASFAPDLTAATGPWGTSFAANLTPDSTAGIGSWTEDQFKIALTKGKYKGQPGGRMLLPPMPWINYVNMNAEDAKAIFTYLKSLKPVNNIIPLPVSPDNK
jgi:mono/diheme cytochrome c family protein